MDLPDPTGTPEFPLPDADGDGLPDGQDYDGDTNMGNFDNHMDATNVWTDDDGY
jgi:hypothetical protein